MKVAAMSLFLILGMVTFFPAKGTAQTSMKKQVCNEAVPPMLEFVSSVETIPDNFDKLYEQLPTQDKLTFKNVVSKGHELALVAEAYRKTFIAACYGD